MKFNTSIRCLNFVFVPVGRFSGLHDMLKIVMAGELEIIVNEERFLSLLLHDFSFISHFLYAINSCNVIMDMMVYIFDRHYFFRSFIFLPSSCLCNVLNFYSLAIFVVCYSVTYTYIYTYLLYPLYQYYVFIPSALPRLLLLIVTLLPLIIVLVVL